MARIVSAVFEDRPAADMAIEALRGIGFGDDLVDCFELNASGQQHRLPTDVEADAAAEGGGDGALTGAAVGGALGALAGAVVTPIAGPIAMAGGLAAGAYAGSLAGALNAMGEENDAPAPPERPAGILVAVNIDGAVGEDVVVEVLYESGARFIELAHGTWRNGAWVDFDPVAPPRQIAFDANTH